MSFDCLIIGNAILGLTTAYRLTQLAPHATVGIIGPATRPSSATAAAGAMLGVFGEVTAAHVADTYEHDYFNLAYQAQRLWPTFVEDLNNQINPNNPIRIHPNGTFILHNTQGTTQDDTPNYRAILDTLQAYQEPHAEVMPEDIPGLRPEEHARALAGIHIPNEGSIDPLTVLSALDEILNKHNQVTYIDGTVAKLLTAQHNDHLIQGVTLNNGDTYTAKHVVVAAGVGTQSLIDTLPALQGRIPRLLAGDGSALVLDQTALGDHAIEHVIRTPNRAGLCGIHVVPHVQHQHRLYLGAGNTPHWNPIPGGLLENVASVIQGGRREINRDLAKARLLTLNKGDRPLSIDRYPLFGASTCVEGLWFLTGTGRDGFQRSPLLSLHIAKKIIGDTHLSTIEQETLAIFETFAPERLFLQPHSQETSIQNIKKDMYCSFHESSGNLPNNGLNHRFFEGLDRDIRDIYAQLDVDFAIPSIIIPLIIYQRISLDAVKAYLHTVQRAWC